MSGLILAGIGKGISDAGQTFGATAIRGYELARQDEREALREERLLARQEALDELKAAREITREETLQKRVITDSGKVQAKATEIGDARTAAQGEKDIKGLINRQSQIAGDSPAASEEEMRALIEQNPQYREVYRKAGYIDKAPTANQSRIQRADDEVQASVDVGAHSSVQKATLEKRKSVLEEIREENKETDRKSERDANNRRLDLMEERITSQNKTDVIRANKPAGGAGGAGGVKVRSTYTDDQGNKIAVMSDGTTKTLGRGMDFDKQVSNLVNTMGKNDYQFSKLPEAEKRAKAIERLTGGGAQTAGDNKSAAASLPTGAVKVGTSGGFPVYQTPDGKRFIQK